MLARVRDWFSADGLVREPVALVHGEPVWGRGPAGEHRGTDEPRAGDRDRIDADADEHGRLGLRTAEHVADLAGQLAERVLALDEWRRSGGFDPHG